MREMTNEQLQSAIDTLVRYFDGREDVCHGIAPNGFAAAALSELIEIQLRVARKSETKFSLNPLEQPTYKYDLVNKP